MTLGNEIRQLVFEVLHSDKSLSVAEVADLVERFEKVAEEVDELEYRMDKLEK